MIRDKCYPIAQKLCIVPLESLHGLKGSGGLRQVLTHLDSTGVAVFGMHPRYSFQKIRKEKRGG
jgi:hypothetical protein